MITFDDLRIEENETISIIPAAITGYLEWFLEQNKIAYKRYGYMLLSHGKAPIITEVCSMDEMNARLQKYTEVTGRKYLPCAIVSHFNTEDFEQKVLDILTSPWDPDYEKADAEYQKKMDELMAQGQIQMEILSGPND